MELNTSTVHRKLDPKVKIAGLEAPDLLGILIFAALMNMLFGQTRLAFVMVLMLPSVLLLILYFGKRDKPDGYLIHLARFHLGQGFWDAGADPKHEEWLKKKICQFSQTEE